MMGGRFPLIAILFALSVSCKDGQFAAPPDVAAPPKDAESLPMGLAWKVLKAGTGTVSPKLEDSVVVHYTGWTTDGKMFDTSKKGIAQPAKFAVKSVIPGWTIGLQKMVVGEQRRYWIPEKFAYNGAKGAPQGMLVFDIELVRIEKRQPDPDDIPL